MSFSKKVKDILIPKERLLLVPANATIKQALKILKSTNPDKGDIIGVGFIVYGKANELLGFLCLKEFIRGLAPQFLHPVGSAQVVLENESSLAELWDSIIDKQSKKFSEESIEKFYSPFKTYVQPDDLITKAAYLMLFHDSNFLIVLKDKKQFLGVVTMYDVFHELTSSVLEE